MDIAEVKHKKAAGPAIVIIGAGCLHICKLFGETLS